MTPKFCLYILSWLLCATVAGCSAPNPSAAGDSTSVRAAPLRAPDVIYVPTPLEVVDAMLEVAKAGPNDVLYDLGSGDGRIPITAVERFNVRRAVGIEINPDRIEQARASARRAHVEGRVEFRNEDLFVADFSEASIVTLYLLPRLNVKLLPRLLELRPGTRIVSHAFDMGAWRPEQTLRVQGRTVYFWTVPAPGTPEARAALAAAGATRKD
jgi:trans-aconitate methyltransferase